MTDIRKNIPVGEQTKVIKSDIIKCSYGVTAERRCLQANMHQTSTVQVALETIIYAVMVIFMLCSLYFVWIFGSIMWAMISAFL